MATSDIERIIQQLRQFRDERDWDQFHNAKDLALALSIEAAELNELFLWKSPEDVELKRVAEELADVFNYALLMLDKYDLDLRKIVESKLELNRSNYPIAKSHGNAEKHH